MHRLRLLWLLVAIGGCGGATGAAPRPTPHAAVDAADARAFASAANELGLDVWEQLRAEHGSQNLAISPASIGTALAMAYGGARGATASAMAATLHVGSPPSATMAAAGGLVRTWNDPSRTTYELAVVNRLFGASDYAFEDAYLAATREQMGAELQRLDFAHAPDASRVTINDWVSAQTHARIQDLLPAPAVTDVTRLILVNAVYFHGRWEQPFDPASTMDLVFHATAGERSVPTMTRQGGAYGEDDGVQLLELPYAGGDLSMLFVLPRDADGLGSIESRLDDATVARWASRVSPSERTDVRLPRFRIVTESLSLRDALTALGMGIAFSDAADFGAMSDPGEAPLEIDDVIHRVFVELDEEGTEAAAATAVVMVDEAVQEPARVPRFVADHPFLFFLRDTRTGAVLFAGRVTDPSQ